MTTPLRSASAASSPSPANLDLGGPREAPSGSFRDSLRRVAEGIASDERAMDRALRSGGQGQLAPEALIALQARVYRHTQELELGSKVVDKAAGAVKQTLQSQQ